MLNVQRIGLHHLPRHEGRAEGENIGPGEQVRVPADIRLCPGQHVADMAAAIDDQTGVDDRVLDSEDDIVELALDLVRHRRDRGNVTGQGCKAKRRPGEW